MKKIGIALCLSSTLFAAGVAQAWEGAWLLGVSGGWAWRGDRDATVTIFHPAQVGEDSAISSYHVGGHGDHNNTFIWGLLAGYQARTCGWLFGGEINVDWRNRHHEDGTTISVVDPVGGLITGTFTGDHGSNHAVVGLTARVGYEVSPYFMPYIRLGAEVARRNDAEFVAIAPEATIPYSVAFSNDRNHRWGFIGGVGLEFPVPVMKCLSLRAEYNYHSQSRHDDEAVALASDLGHLFTVTGDGHRHENSGKLALVWNFI